MSVLTLRALVFYSSLLLLVAFAVVHILPQFAPMQPSTTTFFDALRARRSYYNLSADPVIPDSRITALIQESIMQTPSALNMQSASAIVVLHEHHVKLWDIALDTMRVQVPPQAFAPLEKKLLGLREGYGTVLFFEDTEKLAATQKKVPPLAERMPMLAEHGNAMAQLVVWTALETEGFGASLHHFNPMIDERVVAEWNVPKTLVLKAQLAFGKLSDVLDVKQFDPIEERVKVHGARL